MHLINPWKRANPGSMIFASLVLMGVGPLGAGSARGQATLATDPLPVIAVDDAGTGQPAPLTDAEREDWLQWLHSLEQSVDGRTATGGEEANPLFPLDQPAWDGAPARPYRHLAIAKAVSEVEAGAGSEREAVARSPLLALSTARNYLHLSEYDGALTWYRETIALDRQGNFRRETSREMLIAAICADDSVAARQAVESTVAAPELAGREAEVVLAVRWLLEERDSVTLEALLERTGDAVDPRLVFWRSYAFSWLGQREQCLATLRTLLPLGGLSRGLNERERSWVLTAIPDLFLLLGRPEAAAGLYERLAGSSLPQLKIWGQLQSAGLAFMDQRYATAAAGFRGVCEADGQGTWGPHACAMADLADQLNNLLAEGERYGAAAQYRR